MNIVVIDTGFDKELAGAPRAFLPKLLDALTEQGDEIHLVERAVPDAEQARPLGAKNPRLHKYSVEPHAAGGEIAPALAQRLNALEADVYLLWDSDETGWTMLPLLSPLTATIAVGHADSESFYAPLRHYRPFLTRVVGTTPEVCVGVVLSCVIDKERVEWISYESADGDEAAADEKALKIVETYRTCFEKAVADAHAAPRRASGEFTPLRTSRPQSWFGKLIARITK